MPVTKGLQALLDEANAVIETIPVEDAVKLLDRDDTTIIDIRDIRELWREGTIPNSVHAPRGMLEAWIDPESPYHKPVFAEDKKLVFFCAGGVRSALATKQVREMGLTNIAHIGGGFGAWKAIKAPIAEVKKKLD